MEGSRKRAAENEYDGESKRMNTGGNRPLLKLLVPNYVAGALIGKGGTLMKEMKETYGGSIRLSANGETYPGTDERIIVLIGEVNEIAELNNCIMEKVRDVKTRLPTEEARREKAKIVLTNGAAGLLIGKGGLTIRSIQDASKAKISICNIDAATVPGERVLTMSGSMDERIEACRLIIEKISTDASNMANSILKYMNTGIGMRSPMDNGMGMYGQQDRGLNISQQRSVGMNNSRQQDNSFSMMSDSPSNLKTKVEVKIEVPQVLVGPILGKQGQVIRDLAQRSGARFKFSDKDDYAEGTTDRILTITANTMKQAYTAYNLVNDRVDEIENQNQYKRPIDPYDALSHTLQAY